MITVLKKYIEQKKLEYTRLDAKIIPFLIVITILILVIPFLFRPINDLLIGKETYYFLRIAENPFIEFDEFSYSGRTHIFTAWPVIINIFSKILDVSLINTAKILSVLLGLASIILFYFILRKFFNAITSLLTIFILILTPSFLYLFNTISDFSFVAFLMLLILFFMVRNNNIAMSFLLLIPFFGIIHTIITGFLLILYSLSKKEFKWLLVIPIFFIAIIVYLFIYGIPELISFNVVENNVLINLISDFGNSGLSLFTLVLTIFGLSLLWKEKYKNIAIYLSIIFLLIMMNFNIGVILYLSFFIVLIAALGVINIISINWQSKMVRNVIFYILVIGILFSFLTFFNNFYNQKPNQAIIESLRFLDEQINQDDIVFTHYTRGHWITYFAKSKNVIDSNFAFAPDVNERFFDSQELFYTREPEIAEEIVNKYKITYIWMSEDLKDELYDEEKEGLQFLLEYSKKFKKIYKQNDIEIWRVE